MINLSTKGKCQWELEQLRLTLLLVGLPTKARKIQYGTKLILDEQIFVTVYKNGTAHIQGKSKPNFFEKLVAIVFGGKDYRSLKAT